MKNLNGINFDKGMLKISLASYDGSPHFKMGHLSMNIKTLIEWILLQQWDNLGQLGGGFRWSSREAIWLFDQHARGNLNARLNRSNFGPVEFFFKKSPILCKGRGKLGGNISTLAWLLSAVILQIELRAIQVIIRLNFILWGEQKSN